MNRNIKWLLSVSCCMLGMFAQAQEKYTEVKIATPNQQSKTIAITNLGLDHYTSDQRSITVILNKKEMRKLQQTGLSYTVQVDDFVQHTLDINKNATPPVEENNIMAIQGTGCEKIGAIIPTPAAFGLGGTLRLGANNTNYGYYKYAEMITQMTAFKNANPTLVSLVNLGNSSDGTAIIGVKISDNVTTDEDEPEVLYTALQHAREAIGGTSLIFFMQYLVENYNAGNSSIRELVNNREIFIVPCLNPDGYQYNYSGFSGYPTTGGGLWRKNRRITGSGDDDIGVDLNRNYGVDFGNCTGAGTSCGSNDKTVDTYFGPSAFSEPETQALRNFVYNHHFVNSIDQHCFGPYYSLPYGRPSLHTPLNTADSAYYRYVPALMGMYNGHRAGNSPETVNYEVAGGIKDWLLMGDIGAGTVPKTKIYGMTGEAGGGTFWAPVTQILQLCKENCFQNLQLAYAAGEYVEIQDKNDITLPSTTGNLGFSIRRVGLKSSSIKVSVVPIENMTSAGAPVSTTIGTYFGTYDGTISYTLPANFISGQRIRFAWKVESGGITTYDTVTKFLNLLPIFTDDMEGAFSTNWTATIAGNSQTRGWDFTNGSAYAGSKSMTESPDGFYSTSGTRTATCKSVFNLSGSTNAFLSFWVKHRAENFRDKLQVQISTTGTNGWTPVCGSNMVSEDNTTNGGSLGGAPALTGIRDQWTRELVDLSSYKNSTVYLRFQFTSDADASAFDFEKDDGFYIDNVSVVRSTSTTLGVKFVNFYGKLLDNNTVQLDWEAYTDQDHDYFEVEKSATSNGKFTAIAKVTGPPPFRSFDLSPNEGNNFYRIKQVDKNGAVTYTKVINITYKKGTAYTIIYPNPVKEMLSVKIGNNVKRDEVTLKLTNVAGQVVAMQQAVIKAGETEIKMNVAALPAQVYFLKITNSNNETLSIQKIIKQ